MPQQAKDLKRDQQVRAVQRELRAAERRYQRAAERAEELRHARLNAIVSAREAGMTDAEIARLVGLQRSRIGQMLR